LKCLFKYLYQTQTKSYDPYLIKIQFTPKVPVDVTSNADLVSKVPHDVISNATKRTLFPFITDAATEQKRIDAENKTENQGMGDYPGDNIVGDGNETE
jgi:hypothetical protein